MRHTAERELKLQPGPGFVLPELGGERLPSRRFVSTYHDTEDLVLARHGVTLRHRLEDGAGAWQLKLPRDGDRLELEQPGTPARPPHELTALLVAFLRGRDTLAVARLRTRRDVVRVDGAEIVDDAVSVYEGQRVIRRFRELEVELVDGDEAVLQRLVTALERAGASPAEQRPKLFRALDLEAPAAPPAARKGSAPSEALGLALAEHARRVVLHDPGTRLGADPEELHRMRVATRRLRAALRTARPLLDRSWSRSLRDELRWLGGALGPARDLDVLIDYLTAELDALGADPADGGSLLAGLETERLAARAVLVEALSSDRYLALLDRLDASGAPALSGKEVTLAQLWRRDWKRAAKALRRLSGDSPDDELHAARIELKRARYAAELAARELGREGRRFAAAAARLQDVLGAHQDAFVAEERIRAWSHVAGGGAVADLLVARQRERRREARSTLPDALTTLQRAAGPLT